MPGTATHELPGEAGQPLFLPLEGTPGLAAQPRRDEDLGPMKPGPTIDPTDILAIVLMAIFSMRRMDVRATDFRAFPHLAREVFDGWKARALGAKDLQVNACFAKFAINSVWFFGFRNRVAPRLLTVVGALLFFAWLGTLFFAWWRAASASREARRLGIVLGRRLVETPVDQAAARSATEPESDGPEASSR